MHRHRVTKWLSHYQRIKRSHDEYIRMEFSQVEGVARVPSFGQCCLISEEKDIPRSVWTHETCRQTSLRFVQNLGECILFALTREHKHSIVRMVQDWVR